MWCNPVESYASQCVALLKPEQQVKSTHSAQILIWKMSQWFFQRRQNSNNQINGVIGFFILNDPFPHVFVLLFEVIMFCNKRWIFRVSIEAKILHFCWHKTFQNRRKNVIHLGGYFWRNFKCAPIWKKAKHQNPKILSKTKQTLSAIAVLLLRITFPQLERAQQLQLLPESKRSDSGNAIDFLSEWDWSFALPLFHFPYLQTGDKCYWPSFLYVLRCTEEKGKAFICSQLSVFPKMLQCKWNAV